MCVSVGIPFYNHAQTLTNGIRFVFDLMYSRRLVCQINI